jgi:glycosyltransferase involved in cell wall biosynthesis
MVPGRSSKPRLLFCSYHSYLDSSSGAAWCTRDLFELLTVRGWHCHVFSGPQLDFEHGKKVSDSLRDHGVQPETVHALAGTLPVSLYRFSLAGVPVIVYDTPDSTPHEPGWVEGQVFLALFGKILERCPADVLLTYGGHPFQNELIARAKQRGLRVVFAIHNFAYHDAALFREVDAVLVPSQFARDHYRKALGLECTAIPGPWNYRRVQCDRIDGRYVTFVNPQPHKGVFVFARIAHKLGKLRPDIPFLVVEGRGGAGWLRQTGLDLEQSGNVFVMPNTADPREFYRVSKLILMPSLWNESFARVPVEAMINGIPVLASNRGGLPETLGKAGFLFDVPARYTPDSRDLPSAQEVMPLVDKIVELWDDAVLFEHQRQCCLASADAWREDTLVGRFEEFFFRDGLGGERNT